MSRRSTPLGLAVMLLVASACSLSHRGDSDGEEQSLPIAAPPDISNAMTGASGDGEDAESSDGSLDPQETEAGTEDSLDATPVEPDAGPTRPEDPVIAPPAVCEDFRVVQTTRAAESVERRAARYAGTDIRPGDEVPDDFEAPTSACVHCVEVADCELPDSCRPYTACVERNCTCDDCVDGASAEDLCSCIESCVPTREPDCVNAWSDFMPCLGDACLDECGG